MKKNFLLGLVASFVVLGVTSGTAFAWTYGLTGQGKCQPDGSFLITWNVDNSTENETLTIQQSSNTSVVPVGSTVAANGTKNFSQNADGTKPAEFKLTLEGNWPSEQTKQTKEATVKLDEACAQPAPPTPVGGRGGMEAVLTAAAPAAPVVVTQVAEVPSGPVKAGEGMSTTSKTALAGFLSSIAVAGVGIRRFLKQAS